MTFTEFSEFSKSREDQKVVCFYQGYTILITVFDNMYSQK